MDPQGILSAGLEVPLAGVCFLLVEEASNALAFSLLFPGELGAGIAGLTVTSSDACIRKFVEYGRAARALDRSTGLAAVVGLAGVAVRGAFCRIRSSQGKVVSGWCVADFTVKFLSHLPLQSPSGVAKSPGPQA